MRNRGIVAVFCVLALATLVPGCGCRKKASETVANKIAEKAIEHAAKKNGENLDVKIDGDKVSVQGKTADNKSVSYTAQNGSFSMTQGGVKMTSGEGATLPEGFPKDVPVYAGSKITMAMADNDQHSYSVAGETKDALQTVADKSKKDLLANGWKEQQSLNQAGDNPMVMLNYTKDERAVMFTIHAENGTTAFSIVVSKQ